MDYTLYQTVLKGFNFFLVWTKEDSSLVQIYVKYCNGRTLRCTYHIYIKRVFICVLNSEDDERMPDWHWQLVLLTFYWKQVWSQEKRLGLSQIHYMHLGCFHTAASCSYLYYILCAAIIAYQTVSPKLGEVYSSNLAL